MYHSYKLSAPLKSADTSLVRIDGEKLSSNVRNHIESLKPKIEALLVKKGELEEEYRVKAAEKTFDEMQYIKGKARIDIKKAVMAATVELPPQNWLQAVMCRHTYEIDTARLTAEILSLASQMPENLKKFWNYARVMMITDRYNFKAGKIDDIEINRLCDGLANYTYSPYIESSMAVLYSDYFGSYEFKRPMIEDFDYKAYRDVEIELEELLEETKSLERYKNLKGDVFLAINEYNALGEFV